MPNYKALMVTIEDTSVTVFPTSTDKTHFKIESYNLHNYVYSSEY